MANFLSSFLEFTVIAMKIYCILEINFSLLSIVFNTLWALSAMYICIYIYTYISAYVILDFDLYCIQIPGNSKIAQNKFY